MPFIKSSQSLKSKLGVSKLSNPVIVGILAIALIALILLGQNIYQMLSGDSFFLSKVSEDESNVAQFADSDEKQDSWNSKDEHFPEGEQKEFVEASATQLSRGDSKANANASEVVIYISGAVKTPGVYTFTSGARVNDAVTAAGGFDDDASADSINLARILQDGEQIIVLTKEQATSIGTSSQPFSFDSFSNEESNPKSSIVNINTAEKNELVSLPGIGSATAEKIIASREIEGSFASKEDLMRVSGIGEKKYEAIKELICVQ